MPEVVVKKEEVLVERSIIPHILWQLYSAYMIYHLSLESAVIYRIQTAHFVTDQTTEYTPGHTPFRQELVCESYAGFKNQLSVLNFNV